MQNTAKRYERVKSAWLFPAFLLLAGICNMLTRSGSALFASLMFSANFAIYAGLLLFWIQSVRIRLLPTKACSYILLSAFLMLFYLMLRIFKYRITVNHAAAKRYACYAYWLPTMLIPTLFLMTAICIQRGGNRDSRQREKLLLIPTLFFFLLVMTNDLHRKVYIPKTALPSFFLKTGTYSYGIGFYLLIGWMVLLFLSGIVILIRATRKHAGNVMGRLITVLTVWIFLELVLVLFLEKYELPCMYRSPEIRCFGMLGVYEICIRNRLIPHNDNYIGFFENLSLPVLITDKMREPVYCSAIPISASGQELLSAIRAPIYLNENMRLSGMKLGSGYAFWTEDETEIHKERQRLAAAYELLSEENDLIALENKLNKQKARLDAKTKIYEKIAAAIYPKQKQIEELLAHTAPDAESFPETLARCCMLNAWSKRKSNLLLLSEDTVPKSNRELFLALQESARFMKGCGVEAAVVGEEYAEFSLALVNELYDTFETIIEAFLPCLKRMTVSLTACGVRMAMETENEPALPETSLPVARTRSDGITFLTVSVKKDGA